VCSSKILQQFLWYIKIWKHCGEIGNQVISRGLWSPQSTDLTHYDFYLWGCLKHKVYETNPYSLEEVIIYHQDLYHKSLQSPTPFRI
jgi:hypothetical protein